MKIRNLKARVAAAIVAGGALLPASLFAADLRTNLVLNPGFENVDVNDVGPFGSVRVLDWVDADGDLDDSYAYAYSSNYSGTPNPPAAGAYHYSGGFGVDTALPETQITITQSINLAAGATGALIPTGNARYDLRGFFSTYLNSADVSSVVATFLNASNVAVGTATIGGPAFLSQVPVRAGQKDWGHDAVWGLLPAATRSVRIDLRAEVTQTNHDGYVDLVNFQVGGMTDNSVLTLEVSAANGFTRLRNQSGAPVSIEYYEVLSPAGSLNASAWNSLQDQDFEGGGGFSGTGDGWEEGGGASSQGVSESYLLGSSAIANGQRVNLGGLFRRNGARDLVMRYGQDNELQIYGVVDYVTNFGVSGDYNGNGAYECADINALTNGIAAGTNNPSLDITGDGLVNQSDLTAWLIEAGGAQLPSHNPYLRGDANLDGVVDGTDFGIWNSNKFTTNKNWCGGNFNADGVTDGSDFGIWNANKFTSADNSGQVPEPTALIPWLLCFVAGLWRRCR